MRLTGDLEATLRALLSASGGLAIVSDLIRSVCAKALAPGDRELLHPVQRLLAEVRPGWRSWAPPRWGPSSATVWLSQLLDVSPQTAAGLLAQSRVLDAAAQTRSPRHSPATPGPGRSGWSGVEQAVVAAQAVAAQAVAALPADLEPSERADCVGVMRDAATRFDPAQLRRLGDHLL